MLLYNSYPNAGAPRVGAAVPDLFDRIEGRQSPDRTGPVPARKHDVRRRRRRGAPHHDSRNAVLLQGRARRRHPGPRLRRQATAKSARTRRSLLTHAFWQRRMAGTMTCVGQKIRLNGQQFEVVGVLPDVVLVPSERHRSVHARGVRACGSRRRSPPQQQLADGGPHGRRRDGGHGAAAGGCGEPRASTTACRSSSRS